MCFSYKDHKVATIVLLVMAVIVCIGSVVGLATLSVYLHRSLDDATTIENLENTTLPGDSLVSLRQEGFDHTKTKTVELTSSSSSSSDYTVTFYTGLCNTTTYTQLMLQPIYRPINPIEDSRLALNYKYGDNPLYVAGGNSTLTINMSASNASNDTSRCPLELFLFDSETIYYQSKRDKLNAPVTGFVNRSGCLPVGQGSETNISVTVFTMELPKSYYVMVVISKGVVMNATLSGHILIYSKDNYKLYQNCSLNRDRNNCSILISDSQPLCILAQADEYTVINVTTIGTSSSLETYRIDFIVGVAFVSILLLIAFGIFVAMLIKKIKCLDSESERLLPPTQPENGDNPIESVDQIYKNQMKSTSRMNV